MIRSITLWFNKFLGRYVPASKMKYWQENYHTRIQQIFVFTILALIVILFGHAKWVARTEPVNISPTKIGSEQSVGYNGSGMSVKLDSAQYNPKNNLVMLTISAKADNSVTLTGNELSIKGSVLSNVQGEYELVPTTNNHWTVLLTNLPKTWGAIQVSLKSELPEIMQSGTDTNVPGRIRLVQSRIKTNTNISEQSAVKIIKLAVTDQINQATKSIENKQRQVKASQKVIDFNTKQISKLQSDDSLRNASEKKAAAQSVETLQNEIGQQEDSIKILEKQIARRQTLLEQDRDKLDKLSSDHHITDNAKHKITKLNLISTEKSKS